MISVDASLKVFSGYRNMRLYSARNESLWLYIWNGAVEGGVTVDAGLKVFSGRRDTRLPFAMIGICT